MLLICWTIFPKSSKPLAGHGSGRTISVYFTSSLLQFFEPHIVYLVVIMMHKYEEMRCYPGRAKATYPLRNPGSVMTTSQSLTQLPIQFEEMLR